MQSERRLSLDIERPVQPGLVAPDIVVTVTDIDTAGKTAGGIRHHDLVVHAAAQVKTTAFEQGPEPAEPDSCVLEFSDKIFGEILGSVPVQQNEYLHLSAGGPDQRIGHYSSCRIFFKDIGLQVDRGSCLIEHLYQPGEIIAASVHQFDFVVVGVPG